MTSDFDSQKLMTKGLPPIKRNGENTVEHKKIDFNPEIHKLGSLCKRGHEYKNTGQSFRTKTSGHCVLCRMRGKKKYYYENREKILKYSKKYILKNSDKIRAYKKKYSSENKEKLKKLKKREYIKHRDKYIARAADRYSKNHKKILKHKRIDALVLSDGYIISQLKQGMFKGVLNIPQNIIKLKREQITIHRQIKEARHGITGTQKIGF